MTKAKKRANRQKRKAIALKQKQEAALLAVIDDGWHKVQMKAVETELRAMTPERLETITRDIVKFERKFFERERYEEFHVKVDLECRDKDGYIDSRKLAQRVEAEFKDPAIIEYYFSNYGHLIYKAAKDENLELEVLDRKLVSADHDPFHKPGSTM